MVEELARVDWPETLRVPLEVSEDVAVIDPPVNVAIVALVVVELPTIKLVMLAKVATREEMKELVLVLLEKKRLVAVIPVAEAVESVVWPETVRVVAVVVASVEVPVTPRVPPIVSLPVTVEVPTVCVLAVR